MAKKQSLLEWYKEQTAPSKESVESKGEDSSKNGERSEAPSSARLSGSEEVKK